MRAHTTHNSLPIINKHNCFTLCSACMGYHSTVVGSMCRLLLRPSPNRTISKCESTAEHKHNKPNRRFHRHLSSKYVHIGRGKPTQAVTALCDLLGTYRLGTLPLLSGRCEAGAACPKAVLMSFFYVPVAQFRVKKVAGYHQHKHKIQFHIGHTFFNITKAPGPFQICLDPRREP